VQVKPATFGDWIGGARLQTLPLAIAPVAVGFGAAYVLRPDDAGPMWGVWRGLLALAVALLLQIGVNFANDYSDGVRGTDAHRVGPQRLTASGKAKPRTVLTVALVFFGLAALAGGALVVLSQQWWLIAVGAAAIAAAWFYTGGKRPYGYYGLGEVFVFLFFGIVATAGTTFVIVGTVTAESWLGGVATGLLACAALMINNIRDIDQDRLARKRTLAVLIGALPARIVYAVLMLAPFGILVFYVLLYTNAYLVYFALLAAVPAVIIAFTARTGRELVLALRLTALTSLAYGLGVGAAIAF
jgi:1,4-dihydroxy-2-naphthoate polyprenyltransferase